MKKLKESISSNTWKIIELYNKIDSYALDTSPDFQRKLVWKKQHKYAFINTILLNYPFPEIYIASSDMDVDEIRAKEIVVDGKQRITAIIDYIKGEGDFKGTKKVKSFESLSTDEKKQFLNYPITVKDLKDLDIETIKDIFQKINSTDYSLNANEKINAKYGDGEFSMFCRQVIDRDFNPTEEESDVVIEKSEKEVLNSFFRRNLVFNENDRNRMFDTHFVMLIVSTILDGDYFGRSSSINNYLETYNSQFSLYREILDKVKKSINTIEQMELPAASYWFNKANLFSLIIELSKVDTGQIDLEKLEVKLLELEKKADIYFTEDDIGGITDDEKKYFEYSRQGVNELQARRHRGAVIREILSESQVVQNNEHGNEGMNIVKLQQAKYPYSILCPTPTGFSKNIIDATNLLRRFLVSNEVHDFNRQELGPDHKVSKFVYFVEDNGEKIKTVMSLYRTGRGDYRMWFSDLNNFASPSDKLAVVIKGEEIEVWNISKYFYE